MEIDDEYQMLLAEDIQIELTVTLFFRIHANKQYDNTQQHIPVTIRPSACILSMWQSMSIVLD